LGLGLGGAALNEEGFSPVHALVLEPSAKFSPEWIDKDQEREKDQLAESRELIAQGHGAFK
jgi:hypothetical protein